MNGPGFVFHFYLSTCTVCIYTVDFLVFCFSLHLPAIGVQIHLFIYVFIYNFKGDFTFLVGFVFICHF